MLLSIWQLTEVATRTETLDRGKAAAKAVLYAALAYTTFKFASGGRSSSSKQTKDFTATLMEQSFGQILVGLIGLVVIGVGGYHIYKGWKEKFLEDLQEHPGKWAVIAGKVGYIAKGVALIVVGFLFLTAAVKHKPGQSTGLDGALKELRDAPVASSCCSRWGSGSRCTASTRSLALATPTCDRCVPRGPGGGSPRPAARRRCR